MQPRTEIFAHRVGDYMREKPVQVQVDAKVSELLAAMVSAGRTTALVVNGEGALTGIVTEQDVTRKIALKCQGSEPVGAVMTSPVTSVAAKDFLYIAIARMRRHGWRHMPVVDYQMRPVGIIDLSKALAVAGKQIMHEIDLVTRDGSLQGLKEIKAAQVELAASLLEDRVPAPEAQSVVSRINRGIHARILDSHLDAMAQAGWGEPPVRFCLLIMGSGGRGESFLHPDQDNGFILEDYPDSEHPRVDRFFIELAERMTRDLDEVGFPYCNGYVMATNPLWRKSISQWVEQVAMWGRKRSTIAIQLSDIFFDFQPAYGKTEMAELLRARVSEMAQKSPAFLSGLCEEVSRVGVALGWFGRFVVEKDDLDLKGKINMKHSGTLPLVSYVRLMALRAGIKKTSTLARIRELHAAGALDHNETDYLRGAFTHITGLLLRQQLADFKAGKPVTNHVDPKDLSERERDILVDSFKAIDALGKRVKSEMTGELF